MIIGDINYLTDKYNHSVTGNDVTNVCIFSVILQIASYLPNLHRDCAKLQNDAMICFDASPNNS